MLAKFLNRLRKKVASGIAPKRAWSYVTHTAYPEIVSQDDGSWILRFYSYDPVCWIFQGKEHKELPAFPEPNCQHPTYFAAGTAPKANVELWQKYYAERPQAVHLMLEIQGKEKNKLTAQIVAGRHMRRNLVKFRRIV